MRSLSAITWLTCRSTSIRQVLAGDQGNVEKPAKLSLADIRKMPAIEFVAVNQCSGNSRGFFTPRVAGGQLGNGAMGNARWKGVPLKTVLDKAGVKAGTKQVVFGGMDGPVSDKTPDFAKALDIDHARDGEVMLAYSMNGRNCRSSMDFRCASSCRVITALTGLSISTRSIWSTIFSTDSG